MSKLIGDIRLYMSQVPNVDGQPLPKECGRKALTLHLRRIAMKLRELGFSLGDFDHLYVNLTPCLPAGEVRLAGRSVHRETSWLRYVDAGVTETQLADMISLDTLALSLTNKALLLFAPDDSDLIRTAFVEAAKGQEMRMLFKKKTVGKLTAVIFLRLVDSGLYHPLLCVYEESSAEVMHTDLPPCLELHALGEISVSQKTVTIKPRKNAFAAHLTPMTFPIEP